MKWSLISDSFGVTHHSDVGKSLRFLRFTLLKCQSPASSDPDTMTDDPYQYLLSRTLEFCQWTTVACEHRAMINFSTFGRTTAISGGATNVPKFQPESLPAFEPQLSTVIGQRQTFNLQDQQTFQLLFWVFQDGSTWNIPSRDWNVRHHVGTQKQTVKSILTRCQFIDFFSSLPRATHRTESHASTSQIHVL